MKKIKFSNWYLIGVLIWGIIRIARYNGIYIPFINEYLTDLYSMPMICYTVQNAANYIYKTRIELSFRLILFMTINVSVLFEVISPYFSKIHTGDFFDVIAYFTGAIVYYFARRRYLSKVRQSNSLQFSHPDSL